MFCSRCGNELPDNARFCNKCGAEIGMAHTSTQQHQARTVLPMHGAIPAFIAIVAILMLYFAPIIRFDIFFVNRELSLMDLFFRYSEIAPYFSSGNQSLYSRIMTVTIISMAISLCAAYGILRCFKNKKVVGFLWLIPAMALVFAFTLLHASSETQGVVSPDTWLWITLAVGAAAAVVNHIREQQMS